MNIKKKNFEVNSIFAHLLSINLTKKKLLQLFRASCKLVPKTPL